jgi:hypothetical protein
MSSEGKAEYVNNLCLQLAQQAAEASRLGEVGFHRIVAQPDCIVEIVVVIKAKV